MRFNTSLAIIPLSKANEKRFSLTFITFPKLLISCVLLLQTFYSSWKSRSSNLLPSRNSPEVRYLPVERSWCLMRFWGMRSWQKIQSPEKGEESRNLGEGFGWLWIARFWILSVGQVSTIQQNLSSSNPSLHSSVPSEKNSELMLRLPWMLIVYLPSHTLTFNSFPFQISFLAFSISLFHSIQESTKGYTLWLPSLKSFRLWSDIN